MDYSLINITTIGTDDIGALSFFEGTHDVPFEIKRIYYIHGAPSGVKRGAHAHIELQQILFCPYGKIEILLDDGMQKASVMLDDPSKGLIIGPGLWRDMVWHQEDSVLCVAASEYYNESDYIRDYHVFLDRVKKASEKPDQTQMQSCII